MPYYFAYGSCMDEKDLARSVKAKRVGIVRALNYKLDFTRYSASRKGGVADIVKSKGDYVEGVLFEVPDFHGLDAREGHPFFYKRRKIKVVNVETGEVKMVWTYEIVRKSYYFVPPTNAYMNIIWNGANQLSKEYRRYLSNQFNEIVEQKKRDKLIRMPLLTAKR